jgi:hypothetical protein
VTFEGNAPTAGFDVFLGNDGLTAVTRLIGTTGWGATWGGKPVVISPLRELDGFKYTVSDGSATVIGCSEACPTTIVIPASFDGSPVVSLSNYAFANNNLTSVTIPDSVTSIGSSAFANNNLTSVTIPDSVTSIGDYAFLRNALTSVTIPDSVTSIGDYAFDSNQLTSVTIPDSVTSIGDYAFADNNLTSVTIPDSVTSIGDYAFADNNLTSVTIPDSVTSIGSSAFANNNLTSVTIPDSITSIGSNAFAANQLTSVTIPNSVTSIGSGAFMLNQLTSVTIPNPVTSIGSGAFMLNQLTSVTIPNPVTSIGNAAFAINRLTRIVFEGNAPTAGLDVLLGNDGLAAVTRLNGTTGWGATWGGKRVVIATRATATAKPTITGTTRIGQTLTAKKGTWRGSPTPTYTYQWYVCAKAVTAARTAVPSTCTRITGATRSTFKLTAAQRNKYVAVLVTGTSLGTTATTWLSRTTAKIR